jgi:hypothetical protein
MRDKFNSARTTFRAACNVKNHSRSLRHYTNSKLPFLVQTIQSLSSFYKFRFLYKSTLPCIEFPHNIYDKDVKNINSMVL